jgi:hypothetical protein
MNLAEQKGSEKESVEPSRKGNEADTNESNGVFSLALI